MYDHLHSLDVILGSLSVAVLVHLLKMIRNRNKLPLPPGPRRLPLIENLLDLPKGFEPPHWAKHKDLYGASDSVQTDKVFPLRGSDMDTC